MLYSNFVIFCIAQSSEDEKGLNLELLRNWPKSFHDIYFKNPPNFIMDSFSWQNSLILLLSSEVYIEFCSFLINC